MQLAGKTLVWTAVCGFTLAVALGFGSGLLVGRQFPAHRFERFGQSQYLLETATGRVCNPFKEPNPFDQVVTKTSNPKPTYDANGFQIVPTQGTTDLSDLFPAKRPDYPPACEK